MPTDAFFVPAGEGRYASQEHTRGPWDPQAQHGGPSSALVGGLLERELGGFVARITIEILRPIPVDSLLTAEIETLRPGRRVALAQAILSDDDGPVTMARAWHIQAEDLSLPDGVADEPSTPTPPDRADPKPFFGVPFDVGYHTAMDVRFVRGGFTEPGSALAWMRPRIPIVAGEPVTPLQRVLVAADSGNGLSAKMPPADWLFINTDLTVHLYREPAGDWVGLDAATWLGPRTVGLATTVLLDEQGPIGRGLQSLLVAPR